MIWSKLNHGYITRQQRQEVIQDAQRSENEKSNRWLACDQKAREGLTERVSRARADIQEGSLRDIHVKSVEELGLHSVNRENDQKFKEAYLSLWF